MFWVAADDVPGPEYASVGTWDDRGEEDNDALQEDAEHWPMKMTTAPHLPVAVRFDPGDYLDQEEPKTSPTWTVWSVFYPEPHKFGFVVGSLDGGGSIGYAGPGPHLFPSLRLVFEDGTLLGLGNSGHTPPTAALIVQAQYDGTTVTFKSYGGLVDSASTVVDLPPMDWGRIGNVLPGVLIGTVDVSEVMEWDYSLTDEENDKVLRYLENKYSPSRFFIVTESGDRLTTESGDRLITE